MKDCWLDPKGKIHEVCHAGHNEFAYKLLEKELGDVEKVYDEIKNLGCNFPYQVLHKRGWIRIEVRHDNHIEILGDCVDFTKPQKNTIDPHMNSTQIRVAKIMCEETNTSFHQAINDKRFW